jgi:hypothetical protein
MTLIPVGGSMTPPQFPPAAPPCDITELLRQALAGFLPGDPLAHYLDRMEGRR